MILYFMDASFQILEVIGINSKRKLISKLNLIYRSALMKSESHKGLNKDENFLIKFYYTNKLFFSTLVIGSEACTVFLFVLGKVKYFQTNIPYLIFTGILACLMTIKMIINVF